MGGMSLKDHAEAITKALLEDEEIRGLVARMGAKEFNVS